MLLFGETLPQLPATRQPQTRVVDAQPPAGRDTGKPLWYAPAAVLGDAVGVLVPAYLAFALTDGGRAVTHAAVAATAWLLVRAARDRYAERRLGEGGALRPALHDWLVMVGMLAVVRAATGEDSPFLLALAALMPAAPTSAVVHTLIRRQLVARRRDGRAVHQALVIGDADAVDGLVGHLARRTEHEFAVVGVCPVGEQDPQALAPVAARLDRQQPPRITADSAPVLEAARRLGADAVLVVPGPHMSGTRLRQLSWALHGEGRRLVVVPGLTEVSRRRVGVFSVAGLTMLNVTPPLRRGLAAAVKSVTDRLGAALLIVLLAPVLAAVALVVRLDSPGPVVHRQTRVGRGGAPFTMLKFRTMVADAEQLRQQLAGTNEQDGRMFKIRRDPRITRAGRLLRRCSLDELPQLFNVVRGDMSLVGPRPPLPDEVARYTEGELRRLAVKPGLTGLWQVSGRSNLSWEETIALDLGYVDNWSPSVDLGVLVRTVPAVITGTGAY
ncbi:exopolysaccharide biosynthesis polyprenyl glycosylphosphotransferase [Streptomyces sp. 2224.1]|uniref:sugar transferase n=1 Tax=unclassified Streptomyces TaxID=2593676 RepID=UPI00089B2CAC|nr:MULTISPECIES: sugar transferase [unclassified Streptomyces]SED87240.1 exopolysaccharide biosynthesis polyprenyl glycosylphosphotransferase [Streptomyces sp. 2112.3]SEE04560.1 exopolysaccharide biosynthesis polyprenyl glycosylphosphotransferase [Streptomyces sp. 2224.1]